jgi:hypothetical protein
MTITLPLQPQEEASLIAMAEAKGLTVDDLIREALDHILAERRPDAEQPLQTAADIVLERMRNVPADVMARMPRDGASQHDHYIYGWPKKHA